MSPQDARKTAQSRTISGDELRARIDKLGLPYRHAAPLLGLTLDGLNKQMRGDRKVGRQTELILRSLKKTRGKRSKRRVRGRVEKRAWETIEYEVKMFHAAYELLINPGVTQVPRAWANAIEEAAVLHARILCEVFLDLGTEDNNIKLSDLLSPGWSAEVEKIKQELCKQYGDGKTEGSPRWAFNKMMAHPTFDRDRKYDYIPKLKALAPFIWKLIRKIESLRKIPFELDFCTEPEHLGPGWQKVLESFRKATVSLGDRSDVAP
jgi:hypothetical protein